MNERDLPCADCGTELVERSVHVRDLPVETPWHGSVVVTECPTCNGRYYPERSVSTLDDALHESHADGER